MIPPYHVGLSDQSNFFQNVGNGHLVISSLFKGVPRVSSLPFEPLDIRGHPMSWVNTSTHQNQAIQQEINLFQECKCARTLGPTEWWSSEGLEPVTLGVWRHLAGLGDRRHLGELLAFVGAPRSRSCTRFETRRFGDGERVFLVDSCSSWCKGAIPFVGAPTWTRGERQLLDTTEKNPVVSCPFSFTFKQFT